MGKRQSLNAWRQKIFENYSNKNLPIGQLSFSHKSSGITLSYKWHLFCNSKTGKRAIVYGGWIFNKLILTMPYSGNISVLGVTWSTSAAEQALTGAFGQILASSSSQFVFCLFPRLSLPVLAPLLFSSSLVSCVQLCLETRLRWWICGCSVSVCLTSWYISAGLNSLSISRHRSPPKSPFLSVFLSLSLCLLPPLSLSFSHSQWLGIAWPSCLSDGTDRT